MAISFAYQLETTTDRYLLEDGSGVCLMDDIRSDIIIGIDSAQSEGAGWDVQKYNLNLTDVVRTSSTVVTITLSALSGYDITAQETLTLTVPAVALTGNTLIVATPTFTIDTGGAPPSYKVPAIMRTYRNMRY
jgi:hypothetical protein